LIRARLGSAKGRTLGRVGLGCSALSQLAGRAVEHGAADFAGGVMPFPFEDPKIRELADSLARRLIDEGKLIEAGWIGYEKLVMNPAAPQIQRDECRIAFFAGAQHLFGSIMQMLEPDAEPTPSDLARMNSIHAELKAFITVFSAKHGIGR
jgi:hypothetical protein